jgi:Kef-type K+ transport system membrane component KefB
MTDYVILFFCIVILLAYIFDVTARYTKIPGVVLLILLGIGLQIFTENSELEIPDLSSLLPVIGTLGLVMIVLEASLDLKLERRKGGLIAGAVSSSVILTLLFLVIASYVMVRFLGYGLRDSLLNLLPLSIISSAVAIPSASQLKKNDKEFVVYESSFSDIFGIILFDFILLKFDSLGIGLLHLGFSAFVTVLIAVAVTIVLGFLLHKITYHVNYVIIMTVVILVYSLGEFANLPSLLLVLTFGLMLSNNQLLANTPVKRYIDFGKFREDLNSFNRIISEFSFLVRSFFFLMFGYYTKVEGLLYWQNIVVAIGLLFVIMILRFIFLKFILKMEVSTLVFFFPKGLITILLFLIIPAESRIPLISEEVITITILLSILLVTIGNVMNKKESPEIVVNTMNEITNGDFAEGGVIEAED